ncbi:MAG: hypothetical protein Q4C00_04715 [Bacillota bacterium]|nr:hypothetical protein [Bacillota bacterium]
MSYGKGVGYSDKINNQEFKKFKPKDISVLSLPALCMAPVSIVVFMFLAFFSILRWTAALILSGILGLVFVALFYLFSIIKKDVKPIDAVLSEKKRLRKKGSTDKKDTVYLLVFEEKNGTEKKVNVTDRRELFSYYQPGEVVRFHPGLEFPEKKQKIFDDKLVCVSCGRLSDVLVDRCQHCHLPLLK